MLQVMQEKGTALKWRYTLESPWLQFSHHQFGVMFLLLWLSPCESGEIANNVIKRYLTQSYYSNTSKSVLFDVIIGFFWAKSIKSNPLHYKMYSYGANCI